MYKKLINFYNEIEELKNTIRYNGAPDIFKESTADHTWRLALMCIDLIEKHDIDLDIVKTLKIALIHDLCEYKQDNDITIADVISGKFSKEDKDKIEKEVMANLSTKHNRKDIYNLWLEYENQTTDEAKFVKLIDRLESMLHVLNKLKQNNAIKNLPETATYADKHILNFPILKPFLNEIKEQYRIEFNKIGIEWKDEYNN